MIRLSICTSALQANTFLTISSESHSFLKTSHAKTVMFLIGNCLLHILRYKALNHSFCLWSLCTHFTMCIVSSMCSMLTATETAVAVLMYVLMMY